MISIVDYGVGNLFSLKSSLNFLGVESEVTDQKEKLLSSDGIILPGVGAFGDAAIKLRQNSLDKTIIEAVNKGKKLLGICLGMQLLLEKSYEYGEHKGLGLIKGEVVPIKTEFKIPHMGWNSLSLPQRSPLFKYTKEGDFVYFVHSYMAMPCSEDLIAFTDYGTRVTAAVQRENVFGTQFHPEKSGKIGLEILRAFTEL